MSGPKGGISGHVWNRRDVPGRGSSRPARRAEPGPTVEFEFGAAFTTIRRIPLRADPGERLTVTDLLPSASGLFWMADAAAGELKVYSQDGRRLRTLGREITGLSCPVSLTSLHGRWVAVLDGDRPRVCILDEAGRRQRHFQLPEIDRAYQLCNLGDRTLAVIGRGWGLAAGRIVHLYEPTGGYVESLFREPSDTGGDGRAYAATEGHVLYLADSRSDSFTTYDLRDCSVLSFPRLIGGLDTGRSRTLQGLFVTGCAEVVAVSAEDGGVGYIYDLYALSGRPIALGLRSPERVVALEGSLFYSVRVSPDRRPTLRVWRLRYEVTGSANGTATVARSARAD